MLATAKKLGVSHYRMGYWTFPANTDPLKALREMKPRAAALAALNREIGIRGGYQNHVGTRVGGSVWDLGVLLEGIAPDGLGVQYDIRHAVAEGGESWPVAMRLIAPHIDTVALKDFVWTRGTNAAGPRRACRSARGWWTSPRTCGSCSRAARCRRRPCTSSTRRSRCPGAVAPSGAGRRWTECGAT